MSKAIAALTPVVLIATAFGCAAPSSASAPMGGCRAGEFRWTAVDAAITMTPQYLTFTSAGVLRECFGTVPGITSGTFTGVHTAWSDCMHPADGPITVTIVWSDGQTSVLSGPWPVGMSQPTTGVLRVTDGLGQGDRVRIVADYDVVTMDNMSGCLGPGVHTGLGRVTGATFE
ncbi:hypothetical protein [Nocardia pseudobrasiliensis]|uniref:Uncharacterized protein n=1 Tax=Nocardia pseudobrasiliensis TaxID=45979 RepID=A0A370I4K5_9NOCA|nr:hypothetical protein [Nocardia pseudobrasiliensis]RDI65667.1 hypothetical protein DFR76_106539 [Nocardia pseudobrasiliensis]